MDNRRTARLLNSLERLVPQVNKQLPSEESWRAGGWFSVADMGTQRELIESNCIRVGRFLGERECKEALAHSMENMELLINHQELVTSRADRTDGSGLRGGAIRAGRYILSFSGFTEFWDEALILYIALLDRLLSEDDLRQMAAPGVLALCNKIAITPI
ncbi:MAG TPA: hypothetical protein VFQ60_03190 [Patescibacteria group bacterium]|nr:hypothetical protein [Patescibacteria group bacterium]